MADDDLAVRNLRTRRIHRIDTSRRNRYTVCGRNSADFFTFGAVIPVSKARALGGTPCHTCWPHGLPAVPSPG